MRQVRMSKTVGEVKCQCQQSQVSTVWTGEGARANRLPSLRDMIELLVGYWLVGTVK